MTLSPSKKRVASTPQTFSDIVGHDLVVAALSARLQAEHSRNGHIVIAGPEGAGKRSLARLYAQALVCEGTLHDGSPCQQCIECQGIERGSSFAYAAIDASLQGDEETIRTLVERDAQLNTAPVRVVVIDCADQLTPAGADAVLKTLERETQSVFLFLARDLKAFSGALRSRCSVFPIGVADEATLEKHLSSLCERAGLVYELPALRIIARKSNGLVGRSVTTLYRVAAKGNISVAHTRAGLGLDWGPHMLRCWDHLLTGGYDEAVESFVKVASGHRARIEAVQAFLVAALLHKRMQSAWVPPHAAFEAMPDEEWAVFTRSWDTSFGAITDGEMVLGKMVAWWAGVEPNAPSLTAFYLGYERLKSLRHGTLSGPDAQSNGI